MRLKSKGLQMENYEGLLDVSALVSKAKHRNQETFLLFFTRLIFASERLVMPHSFKSW